MWVIHVLSRPNLGLVKSGKTVGAAPAVGGDCDFAKSSIWRALGIQCEANHATLAG